MILKNECFEIKLSQIQQRIFLNSANVYINVNLNHPKYCLFRQKALSITKIKMDVFNNRKNFSGMIIEVSFYQKIYSKNLPLNFIFFLSAAALSGF